MASREKFSIGPVRWATDRCVPNGSLRLGLIFEFRSSSFEFRVSNFEFPIFEFPVSSFRFQVSLFDLGGESGDGGAEGHGGAYPNLPASIHTRLENVKRQGPVRIGSAIIRCAVAILAMPLRHRRDARGTSK